MPSYSDAVIAMVRAGDLRSKREDAILILTALAFDERQTVRGLSATLNIPKPSVTRALDALVTAGLAKRAADPKDKRSTLVSVTKLGRQRIDKMTAG